MDNSMLFSKCFSFQKFCCRWRHSQSRSWSAGERLSKKAKMARVDSEKKQANLAFEFVINDNGEDE
jgi:hypothetical protein